MHNIKNKVENILNSYNKIKSELDVLKYELNTMVHPLHSEIIEAQVFSHSIGEAVSSSSISDKTANIAIEHVSSQQNARYHAMRLLIKTISVEISRLEYFMTLLPQNEALLLRQYYFEEKSWVEITAASAASQSTLQRRRNRAVLQLCGYYSLVNDYWASQINGGTAIQFISYLHRERFDSCIERLKEPICPGIAAALYIISGCGELWVYGVDRLYDFSSRMPIPFENATPLPAGVSRLQQLAFHLAECTDVQLCSVLSRYFDKLEHVNLELAIEAVTIAYLLLKA